MTSAEKAKKDGDAVQGAVREYLTLTIGDQMFGIPVLQVQDVMGEQKMTRVPLAPHEVAGSLNLRGRIVTAINMRRRMSLGDLPAGQKYMNIVVEYKADLYSLMVDNVGEVIALSDSDFETNPPTLDPLWRSLSLGIYRMDQKLLVILDVTKLLEGIGADKTAAA